MTDKKDKILVRVYSEHYFEMDRKEIEEVYKKDGDGWDFEEWVKEEAYERASDLNYELTFDRKVEVVEI